MSSCLWTVAQIHNVWSSNRCFYALLEYYPMSILNTVYIHFIHTVCLLRSRSTSQKINLFIMKRQDFWHLNQYSHICSSVLLWKLCQAKSALTWLVSRGCAPYSTLPRLAIFTHCQVEVIASGVTCVSTCMGICSACRCSRPCVCPVCCCFLFHFLVRGSNSGPQPLY